MQKKPENLLILRRDPFGTICYNPLLPKGLEMPLLRNTQIIEKVWGHEIVLVNDPKLNYCLKELHIKPGLMSSYHYHRIKDETFLVRQGEVLLEVSESQPVDWDVIESMSPAMRDDLVQRANNPGRADKVRMGLGAAYRLTPFSRHRFRSLVDSTSIIVEASTFHADEDVVRVVESGLIA